MIHQSILELIGGTPLLHLPKISKKCGANIYAKMEMMQPTGSVKARTALNMILEAEKSGMLKKDSIIVEATSGNQGIALAMIGAVKGYKVKIVMPENMSIERKKIIQGYGAEIICTPAGSNIGEAIQTAKELTIKMAKEDERVFLPKQFDNANNPLAHSNFTALEILNQMEGRQIDGFTCGFGTGGTFTGVARVLKAKNPNTTFTIAEPENAAIIKGLTISHHNQQGIGDGFIPSIMDTKFIDDINIVTDGEAEDTARMLAREEGILCGVSSGTNVFSAMKMASKLNSNANIITLICDTGERYLSTTLFKD
jgi:cysteine synthase A